VPDLFSLLLGWVRDLLKTTYGAWRASQKDRDKFIGILGALKDELRRNQLSLADLASGHSEVQVEVQMYEAVAPLLRRELQRSPELLQSISSIYTELTPPVRDYIRKGWLEQSKARYLERLTRRAHRLLSDWLDREMPLELDTNSSECRFQMLEELIQDFEDDEQIVILAKWEEVQ
jgi:hypothetical protein